jgi:hypothetical protein
VTSRRYFLLCELWEHVKSAEIKPISSFGFIACGTLLKYHTNNYLYTVFSHFVYIILKNCSLNLLSKMFVLTDIIDCIFLFFSKIPARLLLSSHFLLSPVKTLFTMLVML